MTYLYTENFLNNYIHHVYMNGYVYQLFCTDTAYKTKVCTRKEYTSHESRCYFEKYNAMRNKKIVKTVVAPYIDIAENIILNQIISDI